MNDLLIREIERTPRHRLMKGGMCTCTQWHSHESSFEEHLRNARAWEMTATVVKENYAWPVVGAVFLIPALLVLPWDEHRLWVAILCTVITAFGEWFVWAMGKASLAESRQRVHNAQVLADSSSHFLLDIDKEIIGIGMRHGDEIVFDVLCSGAVGYLRGIWANQEEPDPIIVPGHRGPIHLLDGDTLTYHDPLTDPLEAGMYRR